MNRSNPFRIVVSASVLIASSAAIANPGAWLNCTTAGDAISSLTLDVNNAGRPQTVEVLSGLYLSNDTASMRTAFLSAKEFDHMDKLGRYEIVLRTPQSQDFGGGVSDAALLILTRMNTQGDYVGKLSNNGIVDSITCKTLNP